ncbi:MAG: AI-2E family transporter [bacterium]
MDSTQKIKISIATSSILSIALVVIGGWFLYQLRDIVGLVFVAIFLAAAIRPMIDWFARKKLPRWLAMVVVYLTIFLIITVVVGVLVPPISRQLNDIAGKFPEYYGQISERLLNIQKENANINLTDFTNLISDISGKAGKGLLSVLSGIFGGVVYLIIVLVIIFYMSVEEDAIKKIVESVIPDRYGEDVTCLLYKIQNKLGQWLRSVMLLGGVIAILTFFILLPVMPKYALILALFAGLLEFIPYVGPFLSAIPAIFLAFSLGSWFIVIYVIIAYIIIQQLENQLIVPQVMKRTVGLHPIVSIIAMMIGAKIGGSILGASLLGAAVGVLLSIPVAITIFEIIDYYADRKKGKRECSI